MIDALNKVNNKERETPTSYVKPLVCKEKNEQCMYGKCSKCKDCTININKEVHDKGIKWHDWRTTRDLRSTKKGQKVVNKEVYVTSKEEIK